MFIYGISLYCVITKKYGLSYSIGFLEIIFMEELQVFPCVTSKSVCDLF